MNGPSSMHNLQMTSSFMESYSHLIQWVRSRVLDEKNVNSLLSIAQIYGELRWLNHDGVYHDDEVETTVEKKVIQSNEFQMPDMFEVGEGTVLIVSELFDYGGHSAVVMNWMAAFRDADDHRLLITRSMSSKVEESLIKNEASYHWCINEGVKLINEILCYAATADRIVLHIHPDDIVSAIAARILAAAGKHIIFFNHADHVFTYGITVAKVVCEVSSYGIALNKRTRRVETSWLLGIPIDFVERNAVLNEDGKRGQTVLTCGSSYKYAPEGSAFFGDFIDNLLSRKTDVTILLVGSSGKEPWWKDGISQWGDRVRFLGTLAHDKYLAIMEGADIYVDSFPITGGTAFPEALLQGKLVVGLQNPIQGYSPADELRVENVEALAEQVIKLMEGNSAYLSHLENVREKAKSIHSLSQFRERVTRIYANNYDSELTSDVPVDTYWIEKRWTKNQQISLPSVLSFHRLSLRDHIGFLLQLRKLRFPLKHKYVVKLIILLVLKQRSSRAMYKFKFDLGLGALKKKWSEAWRE